MIFPESIPFIAFLFFAIALLMKILFMNKEGIKITANSGKKNQPLLLFLFGVLFLIWLFEITKPVFFESLQLLPILLTKLLIHSFILKIAGSLTILISLIFWVVTLFHFKTSLRFGLNEKNTGKLITTGIFNISRNPFFFSIIVYFIGIVLIIPSWFFVGFSILAIISIHLFILKEEKHLTEVCGKDYEDYTKNVRRYI